MTKNKLYAIVFIACFFGLAYLFYKINYSESSHLTVCIIKNVTGYACPSCGTTRAVQLFLQRNFAASLQMNPFGIIVAILMVISPIWILFDIITKKETFYFWYKKAEEIIRIKWIAITLIILVIINWIWNIYKGL
jgi:transposase-like protein